MQKASVRFRALTTADNSEVVVGQRNDRVIAFEFRNEGTDISMKVTKDGEGFTLAPGEEKAFALDGKTYFEDAFIVQWITPGASPVRKGTLLEMYIKD